jgi:hypothetical protein
MELGTNEFVKPTIHASRRGPAPKKGVPLIRIERISVDFGPSYPGQRAVAKG